MLPCSIDLEASLDKSNPYWGEQHLGLNWQFLVLPRTLVLFDNKHIGLLIPRWYDAIILPTRDDERRIRVVDVARCVYHVGIEWYRIGFCVSRWLAWQCEILDAGVDFRVYLALRSLHRCVLHLLVDWSWDDARYYLH